jgi:PGF-CTERM protein
VTVSVRNPHPDGAVRTDLPAVGTEAVTFRALGIEFARSGGSFSMELTPLAERPDGVADPPDADPVAYYRIDGDYPPDEDVAAARVTVRLSPDALPEGATLDDVVAFRHADGEWERVSVTRDGDSLVVTSPGFSVFALAVPGTDVAVADATPERTEVAPGEAVSVTATVRNDGTRQSTRTVALTADGEVVAETTVTVATGERQEVTLRWTPAEAGTYDLRVGDADAGTLRVVGSGTTVTDTGSPVPSVTRSATAEPTGTPTEGDGPGFGIAVALLALLAITLLATRRRD